MIRSLERPQGLTTRLTRRLTVKHPTGLHVRPNGAIVKTVNRFTAKVELRYGDHEANANGILEIIMLEVSHGAEVVFEAEGPDAERVLDALSNLFANDFSFSDKSTRSPLHRKWPPVPLHRIQCP